MGRRHGAITTALTALAVFGGVPMGTAQAWADPAEPAPTPITTLPVPAPLPPVSNDPMTPHQPPVPVADAAAAPPPPVAAQAAPPMLPADTPVPRPSVPEVPKPANSSGGGILGSIIDIWHQAQNPFLAPGAPMAPGGAPAPPPGAGPAPALPPGYISTNAPGSETPVSSNGPAGAAAGRPALPPGYYPIDGPAPPWLTNPAATAPNPQGA